MSKLGLCENDKKSDLRQKALKERNIDTMLSDARDGTAETDAEHLRR